MSKRKREEDVEDDIEELTEQSLQLLVIQLEKSINVNQEQRIKHSDSPTMFMESEFALAEAIRGLTPLAATPSLYSKFVALNSINSLTELLTHDNIDISSSVIALLKDMLDPESLLETDDSITLLSSFVSSNGLELLVGNMKRLEAWTQDDAQTYHGVLTIFENIIDVDPSLAEKLAVDTKVFSALLDVIAQDSPSPDAIKVYASEILSITLQTCSEQGKVIFGKVDGVKRLFQSIQPYEFDDPATGLQECAENCFDALCLALLEPTNVAVLGPLGVIEVCRRMIKKRLLCRKGALRILELGLDRSPDNTVAFVNCGGLKIIFALLMGKGSISKKYEFSGDEQLELVLSCIVKLFLSLSDVNYSRVLAKFKENNAEKMSKLVTLFSEYERKVANIELPDDQSDDEDELYLYKLDQV